MPPRGPGDKDQEKGLSARSPKALRGLEKVGVGERTRRQGKRPGKGRWVGGMDGWTEGGRMDRWMDR